MNFRLGPFTLDLDSRQLRRGSTAVHVSPKAFELLRTLVEMRPRALSKAELHDRLWPGTFVADANLAILIAEIRRLLGDDAHRPRFVRTLHGFGYAFCGTAVERADQPIRSTSKRVSYWLIWGKRKFMLSPGPNLAGRSPEAAIWLDVPGVSREHARFTVKDRSIVVEDLGSRNGTYRAGERVEKPSALHDGDRVQLGTVLMTFRIWRSGAGTKTQDINATSSPAS